MLEKLMQRRGRKTDLQGWSHSPSRGFKNGDGGIPSSRAPGRGWAMQLSLGRGLDWATLGSLPALGFTRLFAQLCGNKARSHTEPSSPGNNRLGSKPSQERNLRPGAPAGNGTPSLALLASWLRPGMGWEELNAAVP